MQTATGADSIAFVRTQDYPRSICNVETICKWTITAPEGYFVEILMIKSIFDLLQQDEYYYPPTIPKVLIIDSSDEYKRFPKYGPIMWLVI